MTIKPAKKAVAQLVETVSFIPQPRPLARREARRAKKLLQKHGPKLKDKHLQKAAAALVQKLGRCRAVAPCKSGACPMCTRSFQRMWVNATEAYIRQHGEPMVMVSVVPAISDDAEASDQILIERFETIRETLETALIQAGVKTAFGGFDLSFNEHREGRFPPYLQPHVMLFAPASELGKGKSLREAFPKSELVPRPVLIKRFDGHPNGLAYALKNSFARRITLPQVKGADGATKRRNTRDRPLRALQKVELLIALDQAGLRSRIFLHKVKFGLRDGTSAMWPVSED